MESVQEEQAEYPSARIPEEEAPAPIPEDEAPAPIPEEEASLPPPPPPQPEPLKRVRKRRVAKDEPEPPYIEMPLVNNNFWGSLLQTQRSMEKQARREKLSNFTIA